MKGAIREIRKDTAFLGRQKLNEQIQRYVLGRPSSFFFSLSPLYEPIKPY